MVCEKLGARIGRRCHLLSPLLLGKLSHDCGVPRFWKWRTEELIVSGLGDRWFLSPSPCDTTLALPIYPTGVKAGQP